ncbi:uncharacterized protein [Apostichopus japonicus]
MMCRQRHGFEHTRRCIECDEAQGLPLKKCPNCPALNCSRVCQLDARRNHHKANYYNTTHFILGCSFALQLSVCNLSSPLVKLLRRCAKYRTLFIFGSMLAAAGYFCHSLLPMVGLWQLALYSATTGVGFGICNISSMVHMKGSFQESFATVYSISLLSSPAGMAVLPLLSEYLLQTFGIRVDMAVFGLLSLILVPVGMLLPSTDPTLLDKALQLSNESSSKRDENSDSLETNRGKLFDDKNEERIELIDDKHNQEANEGNNISEHLFQQGKVNHSFVDSHPDFFLVLAFGFMFGYDMTSWSIFLVPFGEDVGLPSSLAVWMSTCGAIGFVIGDFYSVFLFYKDHASYLYCFGLPSVVTSVSIFAAIASSEFLAMVVFSALSGFGIATIGITTTSYIPSTVCEDHFEVAIVMFYFTVGISAQVGGAVTGIITDLTGSFYVAFGLLSFLNLAMVVLLLIWWLWR